MPTSVPRLYTTATTSGLSADMLVPCIRSLAQIARASPNVLSDNFRIVRVADHSFLEAPITATSVVVDLGVNRGEFASGMVDRFACSVIGIEPVAALFASLPPMQGVTVEQLALTGDGAPARLFMNPTACATIEPRLSQSGANVVEVEGVTLEALFDRHGLDRVALVKVDIEGAEHAMLDGASDSTLRRVDQFTVEFHDFLDPGLRDAVRRTKRRLHSVGFAELALSRDNSDVLFVNRSRIAFGPLQRTAAIITQKYPRGVRRILSRARG